MDSLDDCIDIYSIGFMYKNLGCDFLYLHTTESVSLSDILNVVTLFCLGGQVSFITVFPVQYVFDK